jgi:hypothetical protein
MAQSGVAVSGEDRRRPSERVAASQIESQRTAPPATDRPVRAPEQRPVTGERAAARWDAPPERRTVTIRGYGSERYVPRRAPTSRRRPERRYERSGFRPDKTAMWAVLLGVMLILAAAVSAHAATLHAITNLR